MRRLLLIPVALLGLATAGALASIKQANASTTGRITALSAMSITVGRAHHHHHLTCALTAYSPGTNQFASGDRVKIACANHVLVAIADVPTHTNSSNEGPTTSGLSGAITALTSTSITGHDGDHNVTCSIGSSSPSTSGFNVGDHAKIGCANGVLVAIGAPGGSAAGTTTTGTTTNANVTSANGPITALTTTSISVQTMTCEVSPTSELTGGFHVGDSVRMYCINSVLYQLKHNDTPPPTTPTTTTTTTTTPTYLAITGTITVLTDGSITVAGGDSPTASLTCTLGAGTPSTAGFEVGNSVRMYCTGGALYQLKHNDTTPPPTTPTTPTTTTTTTTTTQPVYLAITGTISALTDGSITVTGGDSPTASLTCSLGAGTPSTAGFAIGNSVRMYCTGGALYQLKHNDTTPPPTTTNNTTTTTTTTTTNPNYSYVSGTIQALSSSSITVGSGDASKTCPIGPSSPSTSGFALGNSVGMYCATSDGSLYALIHR